MGEKIFLEVFKAALSSILLIVTWLLGQRIIAYWDDRKKRNEMDIAAGHRFFELYGEFKAINRLWNIFCNNTHPKLMEGNRAKGDKVITIPEANEVRWELLKRAAAAESGVESLVLKLAAERELSEERLETLGLFRQAYQKLREAIRVDKQLGWGRGCPQYQLFNDLAAEFAQMLSLDATRRLKVISSDAGAEHPSLQRGRENMKTITSFDVEKFERHVGSASAKVQAGASAGRDARN